MKINTRSVIALAWTMSLIGVGLWAQSAAQPSGAIITGDNIGFRVSPAPPAADGSVVGRLMVKVNGEWLAATSTLSLVAANRMNESADQTAGVRTGSQAAGPAAGGTVLRPGSGITNPTILTAKQPTYTPEALRAKIAGTVTLEVTVLPDGSVDPDTIVIRKSLDTQFGLDGQAKAAAKEWTFVPGTLIATGQRVPVRLTIEMTFMVK